MGGFAASIRSAAILQACALHCLLAQNPQAFEAASVKLSPDAPGPSRIRGGPGTSDPGQIVATRVTLSTLLQRAYDVMRFQVSGPDWLTSQGYDIVAKIPPGASKDQANRMLQTLLAERFHVEMHHETRSLQGFELAAGRAPKLTRAADSGEPSQTPEAPPQTDSRGYPILNKPGLVFMEGVKNKAVIVFLTARAQPLSALAELISRQFLMPIADKTGLEGKFDFQLEFAPQPPGATPLAATPGAAVDPAEDVPNLISAVQQQLGLKLVPTKVPVDVLVIDRADRVPIEN